jgi:hypothetical protein
VQSRIPERQDAQKRWLEQFEDYLGGEAPSIHELRRDFASEARALREAGKFDAEAFTRFFARVQEEYDPHEDGGFETDNGIGNLTLLDAATNRSYGNAIFPVKRKTIIALDKVGRFVPLCTKNVFLKYYSHTVDRMLVWDRPDAEAYAEAILERLTKFFADKEAP